MRDAELVIVPGAESLAHEAARRFAVLVCEAAGARERVSVALSGGSTPGALYRLLAEEPYCLQIPWTGVHLFWADERCVPLGDPGSNYRLAHEALIARAPVPAENVHRVRGEMGAEAAARAYEGELRRFFGGPRARFDLVLLGLGKDGHTASLFPGSEALEEGKRLAVGTTGSYDGRPVERVTLTLPTLNAARHVLFLVAGLDKAEIVQAVMADAEGCLPARRVSPVAGQVTWIIDAAAATLVSRPGW